MKLYYNSMNDFSDPINLQGMRNINDTFSWGPASGIRISNKNNAEPFLSSFFENDFKKMFALFLLIIIPFFTAVVSIQEHTISKALQQVDNERKQAEAYSIANAKKEPLSVPLDGK